MKICAKCKTEKSKSEFYPKGLRFSSYCKPCYRVCRNEYNLRHGQDGLKLQSLRRSARNANTTVDEILEVLKSQDNKCKICFRPGTDFKKGLCVDHCHITGRFRGMLCHRCNTSIGQMDDDIDRMARAIEYVKGK